MRLVFLVICVAGCLSASESAAEWRRAYEIGEHAAALAICDRALQQDAAGAEAGQGIWLSYRGLCLHGLERHDEAVDSLRLGRSAGDHVFDQYFQRAYVESLIAMRLYHCAQSMIDRFIANYPASSPTRRHFLSLALDERAEDVADAATQRRLIDWIGSSFADGRFGLTMVLVEEVESLHARASFAAGLIDEARLHGGLAALQVRDASQAITWLARLDPGFGDGKAGLSLALAHLIPDQDAEAVAVLERTLVAEPSPAVAGHCRLLLQRLRR